MRALAAVLGTALLLSLPALSSALTVERGHLRVAFEAELAPRDLPRLKALPVSVSLSAEILPAGGPPPQLRAISLALNRYGRLASGSLPVCRIEQIQPATTEGALQACGGSLVGRGSFAAEVLLPAQSPFPSAGEIYAFNGTYRGRPAILAHVYGTDPAPISYTLPFVITRRAQGPYGTILSASLPRVTSRWGYVIGLGLRLGRSGYVKASCPAPEGFPAAVFSLARSSFSFAGGAKLSATLVRGCRVRR